MEVSRTGAKTQRRSRKVNLCRVGNAHLVTILLWKFCTQEQRREEGVEKSVTQVLVKDFDVFSI